ncbi:hypothetical protein ARMSODRAFT_1019382 [Armillaria solidipes]|uniref:Uncharacterized protein n=1 Tax=Armillaria solidipes TaxID=1076256 RepID=A0A2H3BW47_9AGAR|nr:hypothetical protein ARMSODRAFT_1019382 [Armillaria solidipes]
MKVRPSTILKLRHIRSELPPTDGLILLCTPSGTGKYRDETTGTFDFDAFKVAPMKVLVQGIVALGSEYEKWEVGELTDDSHGSATYCQT